MASDECSTSMPSTTSTPSISSVTSDKGSAKMASASKRRLLLAALIAGAVIFHVIAALARKMMYDAYGQRYVFFRGQLTNFMYNMWASLVIIARAIASPDFRQSLRESAKRFHPCRLMIPALLDGLGNLLDSVGGPNVPGNWTVLLGQSTVFFTMVFSAVLLSTRFTFRQVVGAALTILGACMAVLPEIIGGAPMGRHIGYALIFFSADIPQALSAVYKDFAFKRCDLDVFYLTACVSWVQLALTWCYLPLLSIPAFGGLDLSNIPEVFSDGAACFLGDASTPIYDSAGHVTGYCSSSTTAITFTFSLSGFAGAICMLFVMKIGSASLYSLTQALAVPITNVCFNLPWLTQVLGVEATPFSWPNAVGVALVVMGFAMYALAGPTSAGIRAKQGTSEDGCKGGSLGTDCGQKQAC